MKAIRETQVAQALMYLRKMNCAKLFSDAVCQSPEFFRNLWAELLERPELGALLERLEQNGSLPYYITHELFPWGETYSILTVSPYEEDFALATPAYIDEIGAYRAYAYVWNVTEDHRSEYGSVYLKNEDGMLVRVR